ncbi:lysophospholipid acyltransferase family protein [Nocardioides donggukensis]|uniref:1-acyl-sn-glycerol-3-phosphate acyltransferase n=1 Tax=Nocardioides donggukensis TaxID=2774019 RepID=A0A927KAN6_9ACTN|nr:lysophospholipid acyltransferase family protein [Nocardioides donggukensis]MBD8870730.1 1-acyl-sn-glycerol-3-phosphate acyltransferase [Nocardioides donggukensis]
MLRRSPRRPPEHSTHPSEGVYRAVNGLGRGLLAALDVDLHGAGIGNIPRTGPVLLASNHVGYLDFVLLERAAVERGRFVRFLCRHDVWDAPGPVGWAMDRMGHVPVDRAAPAGAYLTARSRLRSGDAVCVFPEAGISWSWTVRSLMPGVAALARETGVPIVPAAVWGSQRIYTVGAEVDGRPPGPDWTRGRPVDLAFGEPIPVAATDDLTATTRHLGAVLTGMLEDLQTRPRHRPRPGEHAPWYPAHLGGDAPTRLAARELDSVPRSAVTPTWGPLPADA